MHIYKKIGNKCESSDKKFAIKISVLRKKDLVDPYSNKSDLWCEINILKDVIYDIVTKGICPNLPVLIDTFICDNCEFVDKKHYACKRNSPCVINILELADGTFEDFAKTNPSLNELTSSLFQIMAGVHAIQISKGQIAHYDIRDVNILYRNIKPGGYWHYVIYGKDFYVPNYGKMFILNDFGISQTFSPTVELYSESQICFFELGSRFAIDKDGIFDPIIAELDCNRNKHLKIKWIKDDGTILTNNSARYIMDEKNKNICNSHTKLSIKQLKYLKSKKLSTDPLSEEYFLQPLYIPPMEFYNDTQDVIRMFIGGNKTFCEYEHNIYPNIKILLLDLLKKYVGKTKDTKEFMYSLNSNITLAGRFICSFFTDKVDYTKKQSGQKQGYYLIS